MSEDQYYNRLESLFSDSEPVGPEPPALAPLPPEAPGQQVAPDEQEALKAQVAELEAAVAEARRQAAQEREQRDAAAAALDSLRARAAEIAGQGLEPGFGASEAGLPAGRTDGDHAPAGRAGGAPPAGQAGPRRQGAEGAGGRADQEPGRGRFVPAWLRGTWGAAAIAAGLYVALYAAWTYFHWGGAQNVAAISDIAVLPVSLFASLAALRAALNRAFHLRLRRAWLALGLSMFLLFIGDAFWFHLEVVQEAQPFPSIADAFYLAYYPLALLGLATLPGGPPTRSERIRFWLDLAIVMTAAWMAMGYFLITPSAIAYQSEPWSQIVAAAYPVGDLMVLAGIVVILFRNQDRDTRSSFLLILFGLASFVIADVLYAYASLSGTYASGGWLDIGWIGGYLLFGLAAVRQMHVSGAASRDPWSARLMERMSLALPFAAIGLGYGLVLYTAVAGFDHEAQIQGLLGGAALLTILVVGRQTTALLENARLTGQLSAASDELREVSHSLERRVADRTRDLLLAVQVVREAAQLHDLESLLADAVELIRARFDLYQAQIYLVDPAGRVLRLQASSGEAGAELLRRGHALPISLGSINGTAVVEMRPVIVADTSHSAVFRPNPLLPDTRSEMAVPLVVGERVVGVLDMQSAVPGGLSADNLPVFEALAGQLAIAIENARLLAETDRARSEVEARARRLTREGWEEFLDAVERSDRLAYVYDRDTLAPLTEPPAQGGASSDHVLAAPIVIAGEPVGAIRLEGGAGRQWTSQEAELVQSVARQVAQQAENLRLVAEAERSRAEAEQATRRLIRENWETYRQGAEQMTFGYAYHLGQVTTLDATTRSLLSTAAVQPLVVRGEVIGELAVAGEGQPAKAQSELVAAVAERLSAHIETLRLFEQAQAALSESQRAQTLTRSVIDATPDWIFVRDQQHRYRLVNLGYASALGLAPADMIGKTDLELGLREELVRGDPQQGLRGLWADDRLVMDSGELQVIPDDPRIVDGAIRTFHTFRTPLRDAAGDIWGVLALARDITDRKQAEAALAKRAAELETVAEVSTATSTILEAHDLLQAVVDLAKESFGLYHAHIYRIEEAEDSLVLAAGAGEVGRQMTSQGRTIRLDQEQSLVARAARARRPVVVNDVYADPGWLPNPLLPNTRSEMAVPMIVGDRLLGVLDVQSAVRGYFSDEDMRIQMTLAAQVAVALQNAELYAEQTAAVARLRELDQMKSTFLANMSHELRTPLNSIIGFTEVMLEGIDGPLTPQMENDLQIVHKNGQHLLNLINDVLDMAKIEAGKITLTLERFNVQEILEEVVSITSPLASEKSLALFLEPDSDPALEVEADRVRLRQVMLNLINNAIKFTESGHIALRACRADSCLRVTVRDSGIGIPFDQLETIFQEFAQVDSSTTRKVGGTGLGLPISRHLIELHGGRLWAESTGMPGEGSVFFVELPVDSTYDPEIG